MKNHLSYLLFGSLFLGCSTDNINISKDDQITTLHISNLTTHDIYQANGLVKSGNTVITISPYPDHTEHPGLQETTKAMLYASNVLRIRPDKSAFVCADMYSGVIDFCRVVSGSIERVKMLRLQYPHVDITESPAVSVEYDRDNRMGFADIAVSQDLVYALYSGNSYKDLGSLASTGQTLLVYDWEGYLLKSCTLDSSLANICYDATEGTVYGIANKQETSLIKINI